MSMNDPPSAASMRCSYDASPGLSGMSPFISAFAENACASDSAERANGARFTYGCMDMPVLLTSQAFDNRIREAALRIARQREELNELIDHDLTGY